MRSRYSAFCLGDVDHLSASWHPRTRPEGIDLEDGIRWTGLRIEEVVEGGAGDVTGFVEFAASWSQPQGTTTTRGELRERSRFVRWSGRWWYVDGEVR